MIVLSPCKLGAVSTNIGIVTLGSCLGFTLAQVSVCVCVCVCVCARAYVMCVCVCVCVYVCMYECMYACMRMFVYVIVICAFSLKLLPYFIPITITILFLSELQSVIICYAMLCSALLCLLYSLFRRVLIYSHVVSSKSVSLIYSHGVSRQSIGSQ